MLMMFMLNARDNASSLRSAVARGGDGMGVTGGDGMGLSGGDGMGAPASMC